MDSYLAHGPKICPKAYEKLRVFSCISGPIFLESPSHGFGDGSPPWEDCISFAHQLQLTLVIVVKKKVEICCFFSFVNNLSNVVGTLCK